MATINLGSLKFNWKGAYNSSTSYAIDDVVSSSGNSYVCIQAHSNQAVGNATAYWNIMSSAGTNGTDGATIPLTTQGDILYRDGSGLQRLAKGTAGQVLQMNSGATAPEYATPSGGVSEGFAAYDASGNQSGNLTFSGILVNTNNNMNISNGRYTAPSAGTYYFYGFAITAGTATDCWFKVNGANTATGQDYGHSGGTSAMASVSIILTLAQNDYVNWYSTHSVYGNYLGFGGFKLY